MIKYILGLLKYFLKKRISFLALVDVNSEIDSRAKINRFCKILSTNIGKYTYVSPNTTIAHCDIGQFCSISSNCLIGMATHSINYISTSPIFTAKKNSTGFVWTTDDVFEEYKKTIIGNDVWIGTNVIIIGGVSIGDGAVIGAGAVVTKNVPPYAVVGGIPAKIIRYRFEENVIKKLQEIKWWNFSDDILIKCIQNFQSEKINLKVFEFKKK